MSERWADKREFPTHPDADSVRAQRRRRSFHASLWAQIAPHPTDFGTRASQVSRWRNGHTYSPTEILEELALRMAPENVAVLREHLDDILSAIAESDDIDWERASIEEAEADAAETVMQMQAHGDERRRELWAMLSAEQTAKARTLRRCVHRARIREAS